MIGGLARNERIRAFLDRDWILALALALFVGVVVWFGKSVRDFFGGTSADVFVPAFVGQTQSDANAQCERAKLRCVIVTTQPSDRFPKDVVMGQQPAAGARVREGRQISLIVSSGVVIFPMPDLRFESVRNAGLDLAHFKLQVGATKVVPNDDIPANHIVTQNPPPLASVRQGTKVDLTISKGPPPEIRVPNFSGLPIDAARDAAARVKIKIGQVVWTPFGSSGPSRGIVVRQSPGAGAKVDPFEPVSLQVSAGPTEYGYLVRQVHATATVPASDETANVRIQVRDETGTWNVYDGWAQGGQKLDFNLTVVGTAELETYVNNELLNSTKLGKEPSQPRTAPGEGDAARANNPPSPHPKPSASR